MTESATEVVKIAPKPIEVKQLREFDARLLQKVPDISKEAMQHLIEHPEELEARLCYYGLESTKSECPQNWIGYNLRSWNDFYAQIFNVAPDFSRVYLPKTHVFTYTTPIFVASKLELKAILDAFERCGICLEDFASTNLGVKELRSEENYVASFSETVYEKSPHYRSGDEHYCSQRMSLREYFLWILYCLYRQEKVRLIPIDDVGVKLICLGSMLSDSEAAPSVHLYQHSSNYKIDIHATWRYSPAGSTRRVKLWKSLPQI